MKQIVPFVIGAVLAAVIVFFSMKARQSPAVETTQTTSTVQPSPAPEPPATVEATPAPVPVHEAPTKVPARIPERRASAPARVPEPQPKSATQQNPGTGEPAQTAQNAPPPSSPSQSPTPGLSPGVIPMDTPPKFEKQTPPPREPKTVTIPAGTLVAVRVDDRLSTATNHSGDSFRATLDQPIVVDGMVIAERGSRVEGRVAEADAGGRVRGLSRLSLELVRLNTSDGQRVKLTTASFTKEAQASKGKDAAKVGAAAGIGAAIGAIAGGGKGAAIGAAVGGAAGTGGVMATRGSAAEIAPETRMSFRLTEPISVTEKLH